jgi:hypothetical protein|eukprot:SAG25_NODE_101_length_15508_cov_11.653384_6_plen_93_part_00
MLHEPRLLFWQMAQLRLTGFLYWNLNAWENHVPNVTLSHEPIDSDGLASPFVDPAAWRPWQSQPFDVGDGKLTYQLASWHRIAIATPPVAVN